MSKIKKLYLALAGACLALFATIGAMLGAWLVRRRATGEISARDDEIRRQQAELNKDAAKAALKKLQDKVTKTNEAANVITTGGRLNSPLLFGPITIAALAVIGNVAALFNIK
jgi:hypothetical protein